MEQNLLKSVAEGWWEKGKPKKTNHWLKTRRSIKEKKVKKNEELLEPKEVEERNAQIIEGNSNVLLSNEDLNSKLTMFLEKWPVFERVMANESQL